MAWHFDEINDRVELTDNAALTLPDGDWAIAGWIKLDDAVGSSQQFLVSWDAVNNSRSVNVFFTEDGNADPGELEVRVYDGGGDAFNYKSTGAPFSSNTDWTHIIIQRSGTTCTTYINNSADGSETDADVDDINAGETWYFGSREDFQGNRFFGGDMAEWAKWDRALTADERQALADGYAPSHFRESLKWYIPMIREYVELINNITVTNNGSTIIEHPPMTYPSATQTFNAIVPVQLLPPLIASTTTLYTPTLNLGLVVPLLSSTTSLFTPTLTTGAISITAPLIASTTTLYTPDLTPIISPPLIASITTLYTPTLTTGVISITAPLIASITSLFAPTLTTGVISITAPLIASITTLYAPTLSVGLVSLSPPLIASTTSLFSPGLVYNISLTMPVISAITALYTPVVALIWEDVDSPTTPSFSDVDSPTTPTWTDVDT